MADQEQGNIKQEYNHATVGLNLDQTLTQIGKGALTFALNAAVENYDANSINYQNEEGNEFCLNAPQGYVLIGKHFISEQNKHIFFLTNPDTGGNQIGYMDNNDCIYKVLVDAPCLNFNINHPIHKVVDKITNCQTEIYWTDGLNPRRYLNIDDVPKTLQIGSSFCDPSYTNNVDCNQLRLQPDFSIPLLTVTGATNTGNNTAGTVQFAAQYSDAVGNPYTGYYSVTNPTPIADPTITTVNFNYPVGKSIIVKVENLDKTGQYQYYNLAVIKTINGVSSVELVGTYYIDSLTQYITYSGQKVDNIKLSINDIFEKFPYYDVAQDLTTAQDVLIWDNLTSITRVNYQDIATNIRLQWESYRIPATKNYSDEVIATNFRSYLRDEVYAFEIVFLLASGRETDGFHIPGRVKDLNENFPDIPDTNPDFVGAPDYINGGIGYSPYWKIYNTAVVTGTSPEYTNDPKYEGPYQYGEFAYWESTDEYSCNGTIWGSLGGQKIRHHKFPDVLVSPIYESKLFVSSGSMVMGNDAIFPIGVLVDEQQVASLISTSNLTSEQKAEIIGYKIVRGDRGTNKSIVAKGILRNMNEYTREGQPFLYPNYPYNDLGDDPFLNATNNAFSEICVTWNIILTKLVPDPNGDYANIEYTDCNTNKTATKPILGSQEFCSITRPVIKSPAIGTVGYATYEIYDAWVGSKGYHITYVDPIRGVVTDWVQGSFLSNNTIQVNVVPGTGSPVSSGPGDAVITFSSLHTATIDCSVSNPQGSITSDPTLAYNQIFNSPETSFGQPFLGNVLKLESVIFGRGEAHFVEVKNNAKYRLITEAAQKLALDSSDLIAIHTIPINYGAMFTAYQAYLTIYINGITRKNYAYSFNSIADYNYEVDIPNGLGIKQRELSIERYLIPGVQSIGTGPNINNYERESSVYLKTVDTRDNVSIPALPFPDKSPNMIPGGVSIVTDNSRFTISEKNNCSIPAKQEDIQVVSYYASLKNQVPNQWGQMYSYETIDTGYERLLNSTLGNGIVFGGDTFIGRFAFKTKLPFFIDNRVNAPDDSDIFYDEIGNVAYPVYWHSARSILKDYTLTGVGVLSNIISYKAHNFDCPNDGSSFTATPISSTTTTTTTLIPGKVLASDTITYYDGYFYLFAYGIPNFYCESSYNLDLRQAFNNKEGDFWPHVSTGIPDDWEQESFVSIANDNTYYYNTTYSKQNKEDTFTHLPADWNKACYTNYPFRAIYSDEQNIDADNRVNAWLTYRPLSYFDFPQNYGKLTSMDGIQNRAILVRFENKSLLYNNLLTMDTSNPQAVYVGNPKMFSNPPIDFAETDLGYVGSQHKMLLKIPQGQITADAKRGQIFLISGRDAVDLSGFGSGMNRFFTDHLAFEILRYFPEADIDNEFTKVGLHGVYDSKYDRVIITKLDYIPKDENIKYDPVTKEYYIETIIQEPDITTTTTTSSTTTTEIPTTTTTTTQCLSAMIDAPAPTNITIIPDAVGSNLVTTYSKFVYIDALYNRSILSDEIEITVGDNTTSVIIDCDTPIIFAGVIILIGLNSGVYTDFYSIILFNQLPYDIYNNITPGSVYDIVINFPILQIWNGCGEEPTTTTTTTTSIPTYDTYLIVGAVSDPEDAGKYVDDYNWGQSSPDRVINCYGNNSPGLLLNDTGRADFNTFIFSIILNGCTLDNGATGEIYASLSQPGVTLDFDPSLGDEMRVLITDTLYGMSIAEVDSLTSVINNVTFDVDTNRWIGSFPVTILTTTNTYIYMIWNYRRRHITTTTTTTSNIPLTTTTTTTSTTSTTTTYIPTTTTSSTTTSVPTTTTTTSSSSTTTHIPITTTTTTSSTTHIPTTTTTTTTTGIPIGRSFYVATNGNDLDNGSSSSPWRTIQHAANTVVGGDTVIVRDGVYTSNVANYGSEHAILILNANGDSSHWITYKAENWGGAILDGQNNFNEHGIMIHSNYNRIEGFEIRSIKYWAISGWGGSHIECRKNYIHNIGNICSNTTVGFTGIYIKDTSYWLIERNYIRDIGRIAPDEGCSSTTLYRFQDHGIYVDVSHNLTIQNNIFVDNNNGWGLHFYSSRIVDAATAITYKSTNINVYNNTFYLSIQRAPGQIVLATSLDNMLIKDNFFYMCTDGNCREFSPSLNVGIHVDNNYTSVMTNVNISYNLKYNGNSIMCDSFAGLSQFNNIVNSTDPLIVSLPDLNFALQLTSPCVNAGINVGLNYDYLNNSRVNPPDIGAYEYHI